MTRTSRRWSIVVLFAVAMAWVEAASVYYLRVLVDRVEPYQAESAADAGSARRRRAGPRGGNADHAARPWARWRVDLAGAPRRTPRSRSASGTSSITSSLWIMGGWPRSLLDWDILFLLPLPWWGPVLAPVGIAVLMIVGGTLVTQSRAIARDSGVPARWGFAGPGIALAEAVISICSQQICWRLPNGIQHCAKTRDSRPGSARSPHANHHGAAGMVLHERGQRLAHSAGVFRSSATTTRVMAQARSTPARFGLRLCAGGRHSSARDSCRILENLVGFDGSRHGFLHSCPRRASMSSAASGPQVPAA